MTQQPITQAFIIDHKKVLITHQEHDYYKKLCREYDRANFKGEELFSDHFETNEHGIIIFVKPPSKKYSSLEIYTFLLSLMQNQHLRLMHDQVETFIREGKEAIVKEIKASREK
jgi:hypothetical protein